MTTKITILGDIMCEPLLMKASKRGNVYDFNEVFANIKGLLEESDYVIGNLETPLAGEQAGYTKSLFSFNAPDSFADAVKSAGIDMVLTANNHCLDRGIEGLVRTARTLYKKNIPFAGTCDPEREREEATYFDVNDVRVAIISYTYGTNYSANHCRLGEEQQKLVNLLRPQEELYYIPPKPQAIPFHRKVVRRVLRMIPEEKRFYVKKFLGMTINTAHADDSLNIETAEKYLVRMREDIAKAKEKADIVLFCPHIGGQFNDEPGAFSQYVFKMAAECGCNMIAASHAHVVLRSDIIEDTPCFYSLGNFSMSPNSVYLLKDNLPDYGIAVHVYLEEKAIKKISISILKIIEKKGQSLTVFPLDDYMKSLTDLEERNKVRADAERVFRTVTGKATASLPVRREYDIYQA